MTIADKFIAATLIIALVLEQFKLLFHITECFINYS